MSSFRCEHCGADCLDTPQGYVTGCKHYPADVKNVVSIAGARRKRKKIERKKLFELLKEMNN